MAVGVGRASARGPKKNPAGVNRAKPCFYVACHDNGYRFTLLVGPFLTRKKADLYCWDNRLALLDAAQAVDLRAPFWRYATVKLVSGEADGYLNAAMGYPDGKPMEREPAEIRAYRHDASSEREEKVPKEKKP